MGFVSQWESFIYQQDQLGTKRGKKKNISHDNKIRVVKWKSISKQIPHRLMGDSHCSGQTKLQITKKNDKKNICNVKE